MQKNRLLTGLTSAWRRFMHARHGLAAVEFALLLPLMITLYFGTIEVTNMVTASRRAANVASTAADLTAQAMSVSNADMTDIFAASTAIMSPFSTASLSITVTSVVADASNNPKVAWSSTLNGTARSVGSAMTLPAGLTTAGSSVIVAEVRYSYSSPVGTFLKDILTFNETAYLKPRRTVAVQRTS